MLEEISYLGDLGDGRLDSLLDSWRGEAADRGVLALVAEASLDMVEGLQAACRSRGLGLLGGVFPALIAGSRMVSGGAWLYRLPEHSMPALVSGKGEGALVARGIAQTIRPPSDSGPQVLLLLFDALVPNISSILDALYLEMADSVSYLGACAGSETFQPLACLFDSERRVDQGIGALLLPAGTPLALAHGYAIPEDSLCATATVGNRIVSIGWKPAFEVYRAEVKSHFGVDLDRENFYQWAVHFPFGIHMASGRALVRIPVALDDDGAILCVGEVPENSILSMLEAPRVDSRQTVESLVAKLGKGGPELMAFYCAGRRLHLAEAADRELGDLAALGGARVSGALSLGEIGSFESGGYPFFHNAAIVTVGWPGT